MTRLDPVRLFQRLAMELPSRLRAHVVVVGSLAAAYHFREKLTGGAVNTKDADMMIHPAGDAGSCRRLATRLLADGWRRKDNCRPSPSPRPANGLAAIRLYPPEHEDYFVELLGVPRAGQRHKRVWFPIRLRDGWYGLPQFRFLRLGIHGRRRATEGIEYASPAMLALSNLLAHKKVGPETMSMLYRGRQIRRAAKDLGRVVSLAFLAGRAETEEWHEEWLRAVRVCFPARWRPLALGAGAGLRELLSDDVVMQEAWLTLEEGLLSGLNVTLGDLRDVGARLQVDAIEPMRKAARRS